MHLNENEQAFRSKVEISEAFLDDQEKVRVVTRDFFFNIQNCSQNVEPYVLAKVPWKSILQEDDGPGAKKTRRNWVSQLEWVKYFLDAKHYAT